MLSYFRLVSPLRRVRPSRPIFSLVRFRWRISRPHLHPVLGCPFWPCPLVGCGTSLELFLLSGPLFLFWSFASPQSQSPFHYGPVPASVTTPRSNFFVCPRLHSFLGHCDSSPYSPFLSPFQFLFPAHLQRALPTPWYPQCGVRCALLVPCFTNTGLGLN